MIVDAIQEWAKRNLKRKRNNANEKMDLGERKVISIPAKRKRRTTGYGGVTIAGPMIGIGMH